jgi:hypothetical protein
LDWLGKPPIHRRRLVISSRVDVIIVQYVEKIERILECLSNASIAQWITGPGRADAHRGIQDGQQHTLFKSDFLDPTI